MKSDDPVHETFAARWARRKREARGAEITPGVVPAATAEVALDEAKSEPELPLPSLDDVTADGDIAAFLEKRIPAELHKLALRKAWTLDPAISTFIEMAENQYDWNTPGGAPGYGPLDPSWNMEALLTQATGLAPGARPDPSHAHSEQIACDKAPQTSVGGNDVVTDVALDAPHNDVTSDDQQTECGASPASSEQLMQRQVATADDVPASDMPDKTQRLAAHNGLRPARGQHGGALPDFD